MCHGSQVARSEHGEEVKLMGFYIFFGILAVFFLYLLWGNTGPIERDEDED